MQKRIIVIASLIFIVLLSACGQQPTRTPLEAATATETLVSPTQTSLPTASALPTSTTGPIAAPATQEPVASVSFANDVLPIFNNSCIKCHGVEQVKEGLDLRSHDTLMAGSFNGPVITPGNAADSFLAEQVINGEMPNRGPDLSAEQIQIIVDWINAGALNN